MNRILVLLGTSLFCLILTGCSGNPRSDAIDSVIGLMNGAAGDVTSITTAVNKAVEKHKKDNTPLELTDAITAAKGLTATGKKLQETKIELIDRLKPVTEDEKEELAKKYRDRISPAMAALVKEKTELNEALQKAEAIDKDKVEELRTKIREAEGPFEALARQQG